MPVRKLCAALAATVVLLFAFNPETAIAQSDTWATKTPMPTARYGTAAGVIGGKLYVAGGCCVFNSFPFPRFTALEVYDPATTNWTIKAPMLIGVYGAAAGVIDGKLYVAGGAASQTEGNNIATLQVYDPVTDSWTTKAPMPFASAALTSGVINGRLYVAGGANPSNTTQVNDLRIYDPSTDTWTAKASMPTTRAFAGGAAINGILYAVGGLNGAALTTVEAYDPMTDTWSAKAPLALARFTSGTDVINGILYALGGENTLTSLATVEAYAPSTDTWSMKAPMPTARALPGVGVINGILYAAGGLADGGIQLNVLEAYTPTQQGPPITVANAMPLPNTAGWNNSNVTITLTATDNPGGSGVKQIVFSAAGAQVISSTAVNAASTSVTISSEGTTTLNFFAVNNVGNVEASHSLNIKLDKTPPTIIGLRAPLANANGWNNTNVTVIFVCSDGLSGLAPGSPSAGTLFSSEGVNQQAVGVCQDLAGNTASATVGGISIDKTPPVLSGLPAPGCTLWPPNQQFVTVATISGTDSLSGIGFLSVTGTSNEPMNPNDPDIIITGTGVQPRTVQLRADRLGTGADRVYTLTTVGTDAAGNAVNATNTCTVPHDRGH